MALIAGPALFLGCLIFRYGVDGAYLDQWLAISPLFEKWEARTLAAGDFFAQHNEHRFVVPKLIFFGVGLLTHWNVRAEMLLTWLTLVSIAAVFWKILRVTGWRANAATNAIFFATTVLLFHTLQHENALWGFQFGFVLPILLTAASLWVALAVPAPWNFAAVMLLATASTFSVASGFTTWLLAAPVLLFHRGRLDSRVRFHCWIAYGASFLACLAIYFAGYARPATHPTLDSILGSPWLGLQFLAAYLGAPFAYGTPLPAIEVAKIAGALLLLGYLGAVVGMWQRRGDRGFVRRAGPWLMVASIAVSNALLTAVGRVAFGLGQAMESRYTTYAILLPIGLLPVTALLFPANRRILFGAIAAFLFALLLSEWNRAGEWADTRRFHRMTKAAVQLAPWMDPALLSRFCLGRSKSEILESCAALNRLGLMRPHPVIESTISGIGDAAALGDARFGVLQKSVAVSPGVWALQGWAVLPYRCEPADVLLLTIDDANGMSSIFAVAMTCLRSADALEATGEVLCVESGWSAQIATANLPIGGGVVKAWAYDAEQRRAYRLAGQALVGR